MQLNLKALEVSQGMVDVADALRIQAHKLSCGALVVDCGIEAPGGLEAGRRLAECSMSKLGTVQFVPGNSDLWHAAQVQVYTDQPVAACMASQYAGWEVKFKDFFAMGSGPMRAAANREDLFEHIGYIESPSVAVGVLETRELPPEGVAKHLAEECGVAPRDLILLVAPTASQAGNVQVVARSVETTLHKLHELEFDLDRIVSGFGTAPLPPIAKNDLAGIGRTNDAILYGGEVTLWMRGDDESLEQIGPRVPSNSSSDHGRPFAEIFANYDHDFYKIDRHLFSPAVVTFMNVDTGRTQRYGQVLPEVVQASFRD